MPRSIADAIAGEGWVVDGSFSGRAFDLTLARADTLIVMQQAWRYNADRRPRIEADRLSDHKPPEVPARHSKQFPGFLGRQPATTVQLKPIFKTRHKRLP
jgi:hypothetical protein